MKKILLVVGLICATMVANAQLYVGGSLGFGTSTVKNDDGDKLYTNTNFSLFPEVGFSLNEKIDLGISVGFGMTSYKPEGGDKQKTNNWEVAPYIRYSVVEFGKLKVMGKGSLYVKGNEDQSETKSTSFGLSVTPVLGYTVSEHFILLANLNFLSLSIDNTKVKDGDSTFGFNLGIDTNNAANTNNFAIGFAYIF